jgi:hypothetical protein
MNRLVLIAIFAAFYNVPACSIPEPQQGYAYRCIDAIINGDYDSAFSITDSAMAADSCDPLAPLLRLAATGIRDVDFDTLFDSAAFSHLYHSAGQRIDAYETTAAPSSYTKMLRGFCKGVFSAYLLRRTSYFAAVKSGFQALNLLDESHRLDTANVDPLFLLGLYDYAKGELKRRLWGALFWYPGSKKNGIARLQTCAARACLTSGAALMCLADIYTREEKPDACAPLMERLEQRFPKSRFMLWEKAKHLESRRLYYEAANVYELLSLSYAADSAGKFGALQTRYLQAHMLFKAAQKKEAVECCNVILRENVTARNKVIYKDTEKLLKRINDDER